MTATPEVHVNGARAEVISSLADLLGIDTRPIVEVPCPELGTANGKPRIVLLRAMDSRERDAWDLRFIGDEVYQSDPEKAAELDRKLQMTYRQRLAGLKPALLAHCIVGPDGQPICTPADVEALASINAAVIERLYDRARELCGMTPAQQASLGNSGARQDGEPPSA